MPDMYSVTASFIAIKRLENTIAVRKPQCASKAANNISSQLIKEQLTPQNANPTSLLG